MLAVAAARLLYGLPYHLAAMTMTRQGSRVLYASRRRFRRDIALHASYAVGSAIPPPMEGTRDHFLIERYTLYVVKGGRVRRGRVSHAPYPINAVELEHLSESLLRAVGLPQPTGPPLCHFSSGVDVYIHQLERVSATRGD